MTIDKVKYDAVLLFQFEFFLIAKPGRALINNIYTTRSRSVIDTPRPMTNNGWIRSQPLHGFKYFS